MHHRPSSSLRIAPGRPGMVKKNRAAGSIAGGRCGPAAGTSAAPARFGEANREKKRVHQC